jgi:hypothetical protein
MKKMKQTAFQTSRYKYPPLAQASSLCPAGRWNGKGIHCLQLGTEKTIEWNDSNNPEASRPGFIGLGHETVHIQDKWKGTLQSPETIYCSSFRFHVKVMRCTIFVWCTLVENNG